MQAQWFVRLAVFVGGVPVLGVWCACVYWWLVDTFDMFKVMQLEVGLLFGVLAFCAIAGFASWAIRGWFWLRLPSVLLATVIATLAFAVSMGWTLAWVAG